MVAPKKKRRTTIYANIVFSLIALTVLTIAIVCLLINHSVREDMEDMNEANARLTEYANSHPYTQQDIDAAIQEERENLKEQEKNVLLGEMKDRLSSGDSAYALFRDIFPEDLVVYVDNSYVFQKRRRDRRDNIR